MRGSQPKSLPAVYLLITTSVPHGLERGHYRFLMLFLHTIMLPATPTIKSYSSTGLGPGPAAVLDLLQQADKS